MMVEVIRKDYEAESWTDRRGRSHYHPAHHYCRYLYDGKEIANYDSISDVIYLKTDYIGHDFSKTVYDRAVNSKYKEAYRYLFDMLGVDKTSRLSEYSNL